MRSKNSSQLLTAERLREVLVYQPDTGEFYRGDKKAGSLNARHGYIYICVDYRHYRAHRLAWLYMYGKWPDGDIDHINSNRSDNRIANLRDVSRSFNLLNAVGMTNSSTGIKGIHLQKNGRYHAYITVDKRRTNLGYFASLEEAVAARQKAISAFDRK